MPGRARTVSDALAWGDAVVPIGFRSDSESIGGVRRRTRGLRHDKPGWALGTPAYDGEMRFEALGPLRALEGVRAARSDTRSGLGGPKQRLVLALLLAEPNAVVPVDRLVDGVWGERPPDSARHTLQAYVSELRKAVGPAIERDGNGYRVAVDALAVGSAHRGTVSRRIASPRLGSALLETTAHPRRRAPSGSRRVRSCRSVTVRH